MKTKSLFISAIVLASMLGVVAQQPRIQPITVGNKPLCPTKGCLPVPSCPLDDPEGCGILD